MKSEVQENCSCPETYCPSFKKGEDDIKNLLRVCYTEWVIMGILTTVIMMKMETYLNDNEWMSYMVYSTMLIVFGLPFLVGLHSHTAPKCNCNNKEFGISSSEPNIASRSSKLVKKVKDALGFGASTVIDEEISVEESESFASSAEKVKRKPKSKKRSRSKKEVESKLKRNQKPVSALIKNNSPESESSSSSSEIGIIEKIQDSLGFGGTRDSNDESSSEEFAEKSGKEGSMNEKVKSAMMKEVEPKDTTIIVEQDIFKGSDAEEERSVEVKLMIKKEPSLPGEEGKLEYNLVINVDPDEEDHMIVDIHGKVDGGEMDVSTYAATEGEGQANVDAEIQHGDKTDKGEVEIVVSSEASSSSDEMNLKAAGKKKKIVKFKKEK